MKILEMLPMSDESFDECDRRVVIGRDDYPRSREDQGDHLFCMWGNHRRYDFSDIDAECPFEPVLDEEGYETDKMKVKDGVFAFAVNLYDHSGLSFSLGGDPAHGFDPGGWDTTPGAAYLYVDKERFESFCGKGNWMKVPHRDKDRTTWIDATKDEFRQHLRTEADHEVDELNMIQDGSCWWYRTEKKERWTKTFEDGRVIKGFDWVDDDNSCGGFLTEHADDIDFPREEGLPVFYANDVYLYRDDEKKLAEYQYRVMEYVITKKATDGARLFLDHDGNWCMTKAHARVIHSWWKAQTVAQEYIRKEDYDARKNIVEIDKIK